MYIVYQQLLVQNGKTTATSKQTLVFQKQTTTSERLRTNGGDNEFNDNDND